MKYASSIYQGGSLINADDADYDTYKQLGCICPFCKEALHLVRSHIRKGTHIPTAWRHYKWSPASEVCEKRAISSVGRNELKQFSPVAQKQRLALFERRLWEIYTMDKSYPKQFRSWVKNHLGEKVFAEVVGSIRKGWEPEIIISTVPNWIGRWIKDKENGRKALEDHPAFKSLQSEDRIRAVNSILNADFSPLRLKICSEVIQFLKTPTSRRVFEQMVALAILDCAEIFPPPWSPKKIGNLLIAGLIMTDWTENIAQLKDKNRAIGFK